MIFVWSEGETAYDNIKNVHVTVYRGDTIWELGKHFAADNEDVRLVVERIYKANKIDANFILKPGEKIIIPVRKDIMEIRLTSLEKT